MRGHGVPITVVVVGLGVVACSAGSGSAAGGAGNFDRFASAFCQWSFDCRGGSGTTTDACVANLRRDDGGFFEKCTLFQEQYAKPANEVCMTPQRACDPTKDYDLEDFCPEIDWKGLEVTCKENRRLDAGPG